MKNKLRDAAKHPGKPQVIYDQVIRSYPNAAVAIPLRVAAGIIDRVRKNNWITKAESLEELAEKLSKHHEYKKYYQALLYPSNGDEGTILFFADNDVLKRLNKAKNLYFDENFKITSNHPESMQV